MKVGYRVRVVSNNIGIPEGEMGTLTKIDSLRYVKLDSYKRDIDWAFFSSEIEIHNVLDSKLARRLYPNYIKDGIYLVPKIGEL